MCSILASNVAAIVFSSNEESGRTKSLDAGGEPRRGRDTPLPRIKLVGGLRVNINGVRAIYVFENLTLISD